MFAVPHVKQCSISRAWTPIMQKQDMKQVIDIMNDVHITYHKNNNILDGIMKVLHLILDNKMPIINIGTSWYVLTFGSISKNKICIFQNNITIPNKNGIYYHLATRLVEITV